MFTQEFGAYVAPGDSISCEVDGLTITAMIEFDQDSGPPDKEDDGFWPSLNPKACGYIGRKGKKSLAEEMAFAQSVMDAWKNDIWFYCGVVLIVSRKGVTLDDHAASLWRVECNYPARPGEQRNNDYLRVVANELLPEALTAGKAKLAELCKG